MQKYLKHPDINKEEGQLLFALRSRSIDLWNNYKIYYNQNTVCRICCDPQSIDDEYHLTCCSLLKSEVRRDETHISYSDVFGSITQQISAVKLFKRLIRKRTILIEVMKIWSSKSNKSWAICTRRSTHSSVSLLSIFILYILYMYFKLNMLRLG